ncbi:SusD/RagB family nutrient-binding outer membrane lipoprotein [Runella sp. CRIBMP]|uniref:SusD/RagB family nutrient-binding outer membrane lipoprotein n=1 Tax=Runella sp. CRIBMP TaxID=2683261 RepID=UPI001411C536|nr:SusD/RagB family nutrient-binding outer membrane lipoprotein [Runella sp. CRIBMP]NBB21878.1 SusD/RagB family nutrient-binding outer membrane lipoprotein [Runella sp. CRIBMP]
MKKTLYFSAFLSLILSACSDEKLNEIDTNPNIISDAPLNTILPAAQMMVFQRVVGSISIISGYASEHTNFTGVNTATKLQIGGASTLGVSGGTNWTSGFQAIRYFNDVRAKADKQQRQGYAAIADIMSAYTLLLLVDTYGDIPYKEVGLESIIQPKFDKAQDLYAEMQKLLDAGIQKCDQATTAATRPGNDDLVFKGNMTLWKKTAWGLKARLLNRLSNVSPKDADVLTAIGNSFSSAENFTVTGYQSNPENANPIANNFMNASTIVIADGIVTAMKSFLESNEDVLADPRANIWFTKIGGKVITPPTSKANTDVTLNGTLYSKPLYLQNRTSPLPLLTYTELKFIEAEAQLRLGDKAKAYTAYDAAVRSAMAQSAVFNSAAAITAAQINAYLARPKVLMGVDKLTLKDIITQKYIFLFVFQSQEAYNDVRRTGLITLNDPDGTAKRFPYPVDEISRNANAPQVSDQNTVYQDNARLFWAKL